jgi:ribonuclease P protein component
VSNNGFPKHVRLRSRYDYKRMSSRCKRYNGAFFSIDVRQNDTPLTRLGLTVTRQFGDAHRRNRFKRIIREAFRLCYQELIKGIDINIRPFPRLFDLTMAQVQAELLSILKQNSESGELPPPPKSVT